MSSCVLNIIIVFFFFFIIIGDFGGVTKIPLINRKK